MSFKSFKLFKNENIKKQIIKKKKKIMLISKTVYMEYITVYC